MLRRTLRPLFVRFKKKSENENENELNEKRRNFNVTGPYYNTLAQNEINTEQHKIKLRNFLIRN